MVFGCAHAPRGFVIPAIASPSRHPGERFPTSSSWRRLLNLVIPAKAGIQLLPLSLLLIFSVPRQPPHVRVRFARILRASHFLLLAQEKVTKEKGTPAAAVAGHRARRLREGATEVR